MKTNSTSKKILALSAIMLSSLFMVSGASAQSYESNEYSNDTTSYANAGPGGATAYYNSSTDYNNIDSNIYGNGWNNGFLNNGNFVRPYMYGGFNNWNHFNNNNNNWNNWDDCFGNNNNNNHKWHKRHR